MSNHQTCFSLFGKTLPILCPNCNTEMELDGFILSIELIKIYFPEMSRAPPLKGFHKKTNESVHVDYSFFD